MTNKTMQALDQIEKELTGILLTGQEQADKLLEEVEIAKQSELEATSAVIQAKADSNPKAFAKASQDKRTAQDIAQFYTEEYDRKKDDPFISEEEYTAYTASIEEKLDQLNTESKLRAGELLKELKEIKENFLPAYTKGNELLNTLQVKLLKNYDEVSHLYESGEIAFKLGRGLKYDKRELLDWIHSIISLYGAGQLIELANTNEITEGEDN